jgi:hydrogenase-4 component E
MTAIFMVGSGQLRFNLFLYSVQTVMIAMLTLSFAASFKEDHLYPVAIAILMIKALGVAGFLRWVTKKIGVLNDTGTMVPIPVSMHLSIILFAAAFMLSKQLPHLPGINNTVGGGTAAISLLFIGILFMLTRKVAVSQVIGFLTMENGIYLFALTQTRGMPNMIELGIILDVLVAVMIAGLIIFKIKRSFEHIDVTLLRDLRD